MSFLKIGDRAAGAIKSGGTTRRAAKMVVLDLDHPDIEEFINWKVVEEQKVAALVTGSQAAQPAPQRHPARRATAGRSADETLRPRARTPTCARPSPRPAPTLIPANYIERVLQLAKQGFTALQIEEYDTDWNSKAYFTVSGQNSNNSVRIDQRLHGGRRERRPLAPLLADGEGEGEQAKAARRSREDAARPATCGTRSPTPPGRCADPGVQFDTTINEWHTCPADGRINARTRAREYMFLDDTACNLASLNLLKFYDAKTGRFDVDAFRHAMRLWTLILEISVYMAQFPSAAGRAEVVRLPHARPGLRQPRRAAHGAGHPLRLAGRPGPVRGAHGAHARGVATPRRRRSPAEVGPFPRYEANREHDAARHPQPPPGRLQRAGQRVRGLTITPVGIDDALLPGLPARGRPQRMRPHARARREARLPQRPGHRASRRPAPSAWSWIATPPASSRTSPWSSSRSSPAAATSRSSTPRSRRPSRGSATRRGRSTTSSATAAAPARSTGCPHINPASLKAKGFTDEVLAADRGAAARRVRAAVRLQPLDARRRLPQATRSASPQEQLDAPGFDLLDRARLHRAADRRGQRLTSAAP